MARRDEHRIILLVDELRAEFPKMISVYVFGSLAAGCETLTSDIDLAVYADTQLPAARLWCTAQRLAERAGRDVDIVDLSRASVVMRAQIVHKGERMFCADEFACESFENYVYASYARFSEERRGIVQDVTRRGRVYG